MLGMCAILFDMDGVLVDSEPVIEAAARAGLKEFGVTAKPEDFVPFVGMGEDRYIGGVAEKYGVAYHLGMKKRVYEIYVEIVADKLRVYPDTRRILKSLSKDGYLLALASSADRIKVRSNLQVAGIDPALFKVLTTGEDVVRKKPFPDIYLTTAEKLGTVPEHCIVVEDAISGIQAARSAGMRCIAVATSFDQVALKEAGADYVAQDIGGVYDGLIALQQTKCKSD